MWGILGTCIYIFVARIADVSFGSLRIIFLGKGKSKAAFILGFIEVFIWFLVAKDVLSSSSPWWVIIPYCFGYATGTYVGSLISERFTSGNLGVQIVTSDKDTKVVDVLRENGYAVSVIDVKGKDKDSSKYMLFIEINKKHFDHLKELVKEVDSRAFIVVNDTKYVQNGYFK